MYTRRLCLGLLLSLGIVAAQDSPVSIQVTGAVKQALTLAAGDLAKMPRASVKTNSNGMETVYEGVWLHQVLKRVGVAQGSELRGKALTSYVLAEALPAMRRDSSRRMVGHRVYQGCEICGLKEVREWLRPALKTGWDRFGRVEA